MKINTSFVPVPVDKGQKRLEQCKICGLCWNVYSYPYDKAYVCPRCESKYVKTRRV